MKVQYGLDKIEFISKEPFDSVFAEIDSLRPISTKAGRVEVLKIKKSSQEYKDGFKAIIRLTKFTPKIFDILKSAEKYLGKIRMVEIYKDTLQKNEAEAISGADHLIDTTYLRYQSSESFTYDRRHAHTMVKHKNPTTDTLYKSYCKIKKGGIGNSRMLYLGEKNVFQLVIYARYSKKSGKPVIRQEFRLYWRNVQLFLGKIKENNSILDGLKKIQSLSVSSLYKKLAEKHVKVANFDKKRLSRFLLKMHKIKNLTNKQIKQIKLYSRQLENSYNLYTTSDYVNFCKCNGIDFRTFLK